MTGTDDGRLSCGRPRETEMHIYLPEASLWCDSRSEQGDPAARSESSSWSFSWDWESKREKNRLINTSKVYKSVLWSCMDFNQVQWEIQHTQFQTMGCAAALVSANEFSIFYNSNTH